MNAWVGVANPLHQFLFWSFLQTGLNPSQRSRAVSSRPWLEALEGQQQGIIRIAAAGELLLLRFRRDFGLMLSVVEVVPVFESDVCLVFPPFAVGESTPVTAQ